MHNLKLGIFGYKRGGKDEAAKFFKERFGINYQNSTMAAAEIFIFERLKDKFGYTSIQQCYNDRVNHRKLWFDLIAEYNTPDPSRLGREIVNKYGCYVGMRRKEEVDACKALGVFDLIIWIDAENRVGKEDAESCTITKECADIIITNNGTRLEFLEKLDRIGKILF